MTKLINVVVLLFVLFAFQAAAQPIAALQQKIKAITTTKNAVVGVAIIGNNGKDRVNINGDRHFPLQSVFKFHIALVMLAQIDAGKYSLSKKITIEKKDLLPDLYSPIREDYPNGTTLSIAEILKYTVSESDNVGCEILLKLLGGPVAVESYFKRNDFKDLSIKINEEAQQANWDLQFQNWTTPKAANAVLAAFYYNKQNLLSPKSHDFIWNLMKATTTGKARLKGELPNNVVVAHKTGSSGTNKAGVSAAINDIGIVFLPNGQYFFISVFITNSTENEKTNDDIIARITKLSWDYFTTKYQ